MRLVSAALLAAVTLVPAAATARPRPKKAAKAGASSAPACGVKVLPLVVGNQWTYNPVPAPLPPPPAIERLAPARPDVITITVKSIEPKDGDTVITLEEKLQINHTRPGEEKTKPNIEERTVTSTITCNDKKFEISPDSFFFAGEPGGYEGLELSKVERAPKATSIAVTKKGGIGEAEWLDDMTITWAQKAHEGTEAKLASGKVELERRFTPQPTETVQTKMGPFKSEKLGLITTGRVTLDNANAATKPMELPANWVSQLWLAEGQGMVQALNSYGHMYQLVDSQLK
jgi:hypothetical protein